MDDKFKNKRMGQTIEERMQEYNEMKDAAQRVKVNKAYYKQALTETPWKKTLLLAFIAIFVGCVILFLGLKQTKKAFNTDGKIYTRGIITNVNYGKSNISGASLEVEYLVDGEWLKTRVETSKARSEFSERQKISVYYYEDMPEQIYMTMEEFKGIPMLVGGALFIILGFVVIVAKLKAGNVKNK